MIRPVVLDVAQRSPEWRQARAGRLCGSDAAKMLATIQKGEAADRRNLRARLVVERLTGVPQEDGFTNAAMERGTALEPVARGAYESLTGQVVIETGFLQHPDVLAGCSLDGHVGELAGIIEIKCPNSATHIGYLKARTLPPAYVPQVTHNLWISGAAWCDWMSYDDRLPEGLQTVLVRVPRESLDIAGYEAKALAFLAEVEAEVSELRKLSGVA